MSKVDLKLVKELREKLGVGIADCTKALQEANGDIAKASTILREKGIASAEKKSSRVTNEGAMSFKQDGDLLAVIELKCETDFVTRNANFKNLLNLTLEQILSTKPSSLEELMNSLYKGAPFAEEFNLQKMSMGENISIQFFKLISLNNCSYSFYIHNAIPNSENSGQILTLAFLDDKYDNVDVLRFVKQVCTHIAASSPVSISAEDMDQVFLEYEKEIFKKQAAASGKPQNVIEKMIEGKVKKLIQENTLMSQQYLYNPDITVQEALAQANKEMGMNFKIKSFCRFQLNGDNK